MGTRSMSAKRPATGKRVQDYINLAAMLPALETLDRILRPQVRAMIDPPPEPAQAARRAGGHPADLLQERRGARQ